MRKNKNKIISIFILLFVLTLKGIFAQVLPPPPSFPKIQNVSFGFTTPSPKTLYVRATPSLACKFGAQRNIKKATLFALLDWKGDNTDASTAEYKVDVSVIAYSTYTGTSGSIPLVSAPITLIVNKNQPQSYLAVDFTGIYNTVNRFVVTATYTLNSGTADPAVEAVIITNVYYTEEFEYLVNLTGVPTFTTNPVTFSGTEAKFSWNVPCDIAPNYQFQLLRLFNTDPTKITDEHDIQATIDWDKALTVETGNSLQELKLSITEGTGYYVWRARQIGNAFEGGAGNDRNWGDWTDVGLYNQGYTGTVTSGISPYLFFYKQFDDDKNWIFTRSFIEGDVITKGQVNIGEGINYANGLQMAQQQQTRIKSSQKIISSETIYDYSGRPALSTMAAPLNSQYSYTPEGAFVPAPVNNSALGYITSYVKNTSGVVYSCLLYTSDAADE